MAKRSENVADRLDRDRSVELFVEIVRSTIRKRFGRFEIEGDADVHGENARIGKFFTSPNRKRGFKKYSFSKTSIQIDFKTVLLCASK